MNDLPKGASNFFSQQVAIIHSTKILLKKVSKFQVYFIQYKIITWQKSLYNNSEVQMSFQKIDISLDLAFGKIILT